MNRYIFLLVTLVCLAHPPVSGQTYTLFGVGRELTSSLINNLYQDSHGMMWVATEEGLNCYDGNKFRQYRHSPTDPSTLCSNFINSLYENAAGELIVCTNRGMQVYHPSTRNFSGRLKDEKGEEFSGSVMQVIPRANGDFWIVGDSVKIIPAPGKKSWEGIQFSRLPISSGALRHVHCGVEDAQGNLWLSQRERGLLCLTPGNRLLRFFGSGGDPNVQCMTLGSDGQLYLGTVSHGLLRFNADNSSFEHLSPFTGKAIQNLYVDSNGHILQATDGTGIISYNPETGKTVPLHAGSGPMGTINAKTHCVVRDDCGNLWIGIFQKGVLMLPNYTNNFGYIGPKSERYNLIGNKCVSSIFRDSEGILWVGADNDGIYSLNRDLTPRSHFCNDAISVPMCIFEDSRRNLWVGTYQAGVGTLDRITGELRRVELPSRSGMCFAITEDRDHNVWFGMMNSGLVRYNLETGKASTDFPWASQVDPFVASLYYSGRTNTLYIGTYSGLQAVTDLSHQNATVRRLFDRLVVHSIDEDDTGVIWMGTTDGLVGYGERHRTVKRYGVADGLNTSTVYAVRCDGSKIWMSTNNGIARLDTLSGRICNFYSGDGLQGNEFYKNSVFKDSTGRMYFGGPGGITHFNSHEISMPGRKWTPRIIDIYANGQPIGEAEQPYSTSKFKLKNSENTFSIEFGTRELGRPETVRFAYSIDGKPWEILAPNTYTVNFYDLGPGRHTLRFKAIDGFTESPEKSVSLAIAYPWYSAPVTKAIYILLFVALLWYSVSEYTNRMRNKAQLLELKHSDQLNEARIRSYVNISHEIRTPMSLIISPLKKLLATDNDPGRQQQYRLIMRNAKRVLRLIDELMDLRKIEKHQMTLAFRRTPLIPFIQDVCDTFAQTVADKQQKLVFNCPDGQVTADVDITHFDKILMNLFSNAVKYTPEGGEITVSLCREGEEVVIKVTDTGTGIPEEDRKRIFERFYRVKGNIYDGTGVGLHLAHQLASLHNGSLTVETNPEGQGSCFILRIPAEQAEDVVGDMVADLDEKLEERKKSHSKRLELLELPAADIEGEKKRNCSSDRVLIVEDDEEIKNYLAAELSPYYKVETCSNGREALDIIFKNPPSIILSDVMMPEVDGLQLTKKIKQNINLNDIPVVLISALARDEDDISAINAGADDYFTKPFNIEVVKERMAAILYRYRELKNRFSGNQVHDEHIDEVKMESADEKLIRRVVKIINENLDDPELSVEKLAAEVGLSRVHLHRRLKALTNQSPSDFIRNTRLRQAAHLLREKRVSVAEAAFATGFNSASTFSIAFKRLFGVNPTAYASQPVSN